MDEPTASPPRHARVVRITHWLTTIAFFALLVSGVEVLLSHPRFYWGEVGNVNTTPLFVIPVPASRSTVPTAYSFRLPDQNGWSRYLHFQAAWLVLFVGLAYVVYGMRSGHFRRDLVPVAATGLARGRGSLRRTTAIRGTRGSEWRVRRAVVLNCR